MYLSSRWSGAEIHYPPSLLHPFQRPREREEFKKADEGGGRSALRKIKVLAPREEVASVLLFVIGRTVEEEETGAPPAATSEQRKRWIS